MGLVPSRMEIWLLAGIVNSYGWWLQFPFPRTASGQSFEPAISFDPFSDGFCVFDEDRVVSDCM